MSFKDNQPNPEAENMPMQYARYMPTTSILNYIIVSYAISFLQFGRNFLDCMFPNNLIPYEFNKVEPERELEEDKQYFFTSFLPRSLPPHIHSPKLFYPK